MSHGKMMGGSHGKVIREFTFPSILRELGFQAEVLRRAVAQDLRFKDVGAGRTGSEVTLSPSPLQLWPGSCLYMTL